MIAKVMGIIDLIVAAIFYLSIKTPIIADKLIWIIGIYLVIKGIGFALLLDFASIFDVISGIVILLTLFITLNPLIFYIVLVFLIQKGLFSLIN